MSAPAATRRERGMAYTDRDKLMLVLGPATCPTCLNGTGTELHRQLCEVTPSRPSQPSRPEEP